MTLNPVSYHDNLYKVGKKIAQALNMPDLECENGMALWDKLKIHFYKIQSLSLANCNLTILPSEISDLNNLIELDLSHNKLTSIPACDLPRLERIKVSYNAITSLPHSISKKLKEAYLDGNQLTTFPSFFLGKRVQIVDLENNQISYMALPRLKELISLNIAGNPLEKIEVAKYLMDVKRLNLFLKNRGLLLC